MYSGEDSSGDPFNSRNQFATWALSQTACSGSKDNVDWAALAQQWIQMKESCSINNYDDKSDNIPVAPPPPQISSRDFEEQGEAPMEVVKEDENFGQGQNSNDAISYPPNPPEWQSTWFQNQTQFCPNWNTWTSTSGMPLQVPTQQVQIPPITPINVLKDGSHIETGLKIPENMSSSEMPMDAAKRKTLPAWIREGLEKMEKEKLKQLERNRVMGDHELKEHNKVELEKDIVEKRSLLFQDNSDKSDDEEPEDEDKGEVSSLNTTREEFVEKSKEERIEELMLIVRKSLTELLLEVTNEEILSIAQEAFRKNKAKASSVQVFRKSALTSITSKLGLGAYADSGSDNSDGESDKNEQDAEDSYDSEEELKESIRARHDAFKSIAQKIEASCMESEEREYRRNMEKSERNEKFMKDSTSNGSPKKNLFGSGGGSNYDNDSGETHPDKKLIVNGKRSKERTTRFSSAKDSKYKTNFYPIPTGSTTAISAITSSIPASSHNNDYDKRKSNQVTKHNSHSSDSSSTDSSDSDTDRRRNRKSKSSREKLDRHKNKDRHRERSRDRDRERSRDRGRERSRDRDRGDKDIDKVKHRDRDRTSGKDKERTREKDSERHRDENRGSSRDYYREKSKDLDNEKTRDKRRERSKERERTRDRSRDYERDRDRERDRHHKKIRSSRRHGSSRNSSDSDENYSSRRRHHTSSYSKDDRSRSNTRSHSPYNRSSRSRSRSY